jgi:hypothetical protein
VSLRHRPALLCLTVLAVALPATLCYPSRPEGARAAAPAEGDLRPLASTGTGTLKGTISMREVPKEIEELNKQLKERVEKSQDKAHCRSEKAPAEAKGQQKWLLGKGNGLANVFVWLQPPEGRYFKTDLRKKTWPNEVVMDTPGCAFVPHAAVLFPAAYNPDKPEEPTPTGQKFILRNSDTINHNFAWKGGAENPGENRILPARSNNKATEMEVELKPDDQPIDFRCDIHPWMSGVVRAFDHPYATVTDKDGNFEIKDAPAGAELVLMVWHEGYGYVTRERGDPVKLKAGETTTKDFKLRAP